MQALIPLIAGLGLVSGAQFNLLPYAYLASPLPVYHQYQNTRTGEHAYSYAGGPSAKEEIKDADGVVRGSYSYVDANGNLQSVFYVADDYGFRVASTDLPTDDNLAVESVNHILLARNVKPEEQPKPEEPAAAKSSRRKRSLDIGENQSEKKVGDVASVKTILAPEAVLAHDLPLSTSYQSQVQIHKDVSVEPNSPEPLRKLDPYAVFQTLIPASEIRLTPIRQSQDQIQNNANAKQSGVEDAGKDKLIDVLRLPQLVSVSTRYQIVPELTSIPSYHGNRIELHKLLGIEGAKLKDAVKINPEPLVFVQSPALVAKQAVPLLNQLIPQVIAEEALVPATASVTTSISSHGISQIHPSAKVVQPLAVPSLSLVENTVPVVPVAKEAVPAAELASATITSHGVSQIHGDGKINLNLPVYLR
ncbi:uncharacterized protein LOC143358463 [Halictus rubicundus]|uniref:uncharacterized protein LOC143358463 n=1 Tax=Halictus rubicundus TaxID=77578 RepID=UPI00403566A0